MGLPEYQHLPRVEDLPVSDGVPMENEQDAVNARVFLCEPLKTWCRERGHRAFVGSNSFVYYLPDVPPAGPDLYVVNGGDQRDQSMWVAWAESWRLPSLVIEFISESTEAVDRGSKMDLYRDRFRCIDYFLCESDFTAVAGYRLRNGVYVRTRPDRHRRLRCGSLPLLVGFHGPFLRFFNLDGSLVQTDAERADQERERADQERERADQERERANREWERAELERQRADAVTLELARLRAQLEG